MHPSRSSYCSLILFCFVLINDKIFTIYFTTCQNTRLFRRNVILADVQFVVGTFYAWFISLNIISHEKIEEKLVKLNQYVFMFKIHIIQV